MAGAFVQSASGTWSSGTTYSASAITVGAGNLLVIGVWVISGNISDQYSSISAGSDTPTPLDPLTATLSGLAVHFEMFYVQNATGGSTTVTVTLATSNVTKASVVVHEYSGVKTTGALDVHTASHQATPGTGTDGVTSTAVTTTTNGDVIVGMTAPFSGTAVVTSGTGFTSRVTVTGQMVSEDLIQAAAGSQVATFTTDTNSDVFTGVAAFSPTVSVGILLPAMSM
jgi:hypothetical protein